MQIMKKELDDGYSNVINEFQREQTRLQTRYDQLKQQLTDSQQIIEQLKTNLNQLKTNRFDDVSKVKEAYTNEKYTLEHDQKNIQNRLEHLVKLLEQSNDA
jgi:predicted RNase H-like nuclease (RuvC/YqgF family)